MQQLQINFSGEGARQRSTELQEQLANIPEDQHATRSACLAQLSLALVELDTKRAQELAVEAHQEAQKSGSGLVLAGALIARSVTDLGPVTLPQRLNWAEEALTLAVQEEQISLAGPAFFLLLGALAEAGNLQRLDRELSVKHTSLGKLDGLLNSRHGVWFRCMRATLDGRVEEAEQLAHEGFVQAQREHDPDAETVMVGQIAVIRWLQGRTEELEPALLRAQRHFPNEPVWQSALAWVWYRQGRNTAARTALQALTGVDTWPRDRNWLAAVAIVAEVAASLGSTEYVRKLYTNLLPLADRIVTIGLGVTSWGTVSRALAHLSVRLEQWEAAERFFRQTVERCSQIGATFWLAEAQFELADFLWSRKQNLSEVRDLAREASTTVHRQSFYPTQYSARRLLQQVNRELAGRSQVRQTQRVLGGSHLPACWVVGPFRAMDVMGNSITWRSKKAQMLLKILIARRGAPVSREQLFELLWPGEDPHRYSNRLSVAISTVRRLLDPQRTKPHNTYIELEGGFVSLNMSRITVDAEQFLQSARLELGESHARADRADAMTSVEFQRIAELLDTVTGEVFPEEPVVSWADQLRREVEMRFCELAHLLAREAYGGGDYQYARETYQRIIDVDGYDQVAHSGLIASLEAAGATGQARLAIEDAEAALQEIGVEFEIDVLDLRERRSA